MTKQQEKLLTIMKNKGWMQLGEITNLYFSDSKPCKSNVMKRNSKMASWLNNLSDKGIVEISYLPTKYRISQ